jgi:hypothetical protein
MKTNKKVFGTELKKLKKIMGLFVLQLKMRRILVKLD